MNSRLSNMTGILSRPVPVVRIAILALVVRAVFSCFFLAGTEALNYTPLAGDTYGNTGSDGIVQAGHNWLTSGRYSLRPGGPEIAFRPPVPVFISGVCAVMNPGHWYVIYIAINCVLGALLVYPCHTILKEARVPEGALTNLPLLAIALHPYMVFSAKTLTAINLLAFLAASSAALFLRTMKGSSAAALALGLVLGAGILSHGSFMLLPFACAAGMVVLAMAGKIRWLISLRCAALTVSAAMLVAVPWTIRNHHKFGMFIPTVTGAGLQFWITEDVIAGTFTGGPHTYEKLSATYEKRTGKPMLIMHGGVVDPRQDAELAKWGKELLASDPMHFLKRFGFGICGFWAPLDQGMRKAGIVGLLNLPLVIITLGLTVTALIRRVYDWEAAAILGIFTYIWFIFAAVQAISSYFVMIIPLVIVHDFISWVRIRQARAAMTSTAADI